MAGDWLYGVIWHLVVYGKVLRQKGIFRIRREEGSGLNLVVGGRAVVEEVAEVEGGGGMYGLVWR